VAGEILGDMTRATGNFVSLIHAVAKSPLFIFPVKRPALFLDLAAYLGLDGEGVAISSGGYCELIGGP
jgi:hypothetical protein